jgi:hypothetical protein
MELIDGIFLRLFSQFLLRIKLCCSITLVFSKLYKFQILAYTRYYPKQIINVCIFRKLLKITKKTIKTKAVLKIFCRVTFILYEFQVKLLIYKLIRLEFAMENALFSNAVIRRGIETPRK